jgi:transcriptional regulator with XRE-family HTH domain
MTTITTTTGHDLRAARVRAGLTRAQLASLIGCSYSQLGNIEAGAVPRRSGVLDRAWTVIAENVERTAGQRSVQEGDGAGRHPKE